MHTRTLVRVDEDLSDGEIIDFSGESDIDAPMFIDLTADTSQDSLSLADSGTCTHMQCGHGVHVHMYVHTMYVCTYSTVESLLLKDTSLIITVSEVSIVYFSVQINL